MFELNCSKELSQQKSDSPEINTNHLKSQFELRPNSWTIELVPALPDEEKGLNESSQILSPSK